MIVSGVVVAKEVALRSAGAGAEIVVAGPVTYARGSDALVIILPAGERLAGSRLASRDHVELYEPFPPQVVEWLDRFDVPHLGFIRMAEGHLALGELRQLRSVSLRQNITDAFELHQVDLGLKAPLSFAMLDRARPLLVQPLPGIEWLADVPHDRAAAMRAFLEAWYADVPPVQPKTDEAPMRLPAALATFYELATRKPVIYGAHNSVYPPHELKYDEHENGVVFASERQGAWAMVIDLEQDDPVVYDDGEPHEEPLSGVLLQFALTEAVCSATYAGRAEITEQQRDRFVAGMTRVPLAQATFPGCDTSIHVAPGLVAISYPNEHEFRLIVGSRQGAALHALRDPGFAWEYFNG